VNPREKSPTFKLWDESHGGLRPKRRQAFSPHGGKPRHSCRGGGTVSVRIESIVLLLSGKKSIDKEKKSLFTSRA